MPDVGNNQAPFRIKKLVVFEIRRNKNIGACPKRLRQQKTAAAATYSHRPDRETPQGCMAHAGGAEGCFGLPQEIQFRHRLRQKPQQPGADFRLPCFWE